MLKERNKKEKKGERKLGAGAASIVERERESIYALPRSSLICSSGLWAASC